MCVTLELNETTVDTWHFSQLHETTIDLSQEITEQVSKHFRRNEYSIKYDANRSITKILMELKIKITSGAKETPCFANITSRREKRIVRISIIYWRTQKVLRIGYSRKVVMIMKQNSKIIKIWRDQTVTNTSWSCAYNTRCAENREDYSDVLKKMNEGPKNGYNLKCTWESNDRAKRNTSK